MVDVGSGWPLDELVRRAADALAEGGVRAPNGRVTPLPDRRVVRWYTTIGLVDRPTAFQGRTALYGARHLLQVVAVKRRQAEGRSLAEIQVELTGATDATLHRVAKVPDVLLATGVPGTAVAGVVRPRFWVDRPAAVASPPVAAVAPSHDLSTVDQMTPLYAIPLHAGATLLLHAQPDSGDLAAVHAAARPLLDLLAGRGLLGSEGA
jgi:hypothetical protein